MPESVTPADRPRFSIVTAVYNVAEYLDAFIESIEGQTYPRDRFEVIAVDDGSTDGSLGLLRSWQRERPSLVRVLSRDNAGQASARNAGMAVARGRWVTFPDPDDVLDPGYLSEVTAFMDAHPSATMYATNRLILDDATGHVSDTHPLRMHFESGNRVRDIDRDPEYFHGSAPAAFFPLDDVERFGLRFDARIRPNFEDGHFCCRYLLAANRQTIGFIGTAKYLYRKRQNSTSTLQGSFADPGRYTTVIRRGFLDVLARGVAATGGPYPPEWLQNFILYELSWYLSSRDVRAGVMTAAVGDVADEFHDLLRETLRYISKDLIAAYTVRRLKPEWIDILLHAYEATPWHPDVAHVKQLDDRQGLVQIVYRYAGSPPAEELFSGGERVDPAYGKVRDLVYLNRVLLCERILWVSSERSVRLRLDGRDVDLQFTPARRVHVLRPGDIQDRLAPVPPRRPARPKRATSLIDRIVRRASRLPVVRRLFQDAWILMDRIGDAGDNAERLFDYLRWTRPDINAWFVVAKDAPEWPRLRAEHGWRLIAHGSLRWKMAMIHCQHLISSHADVPIMRPPVLLSFMKPRWRFTFLQHGVIKDDLSAWLNPKGIDLFVTSTPEEHASIVGDHTPYVFTQKEVKLTGLPRFDRLLRVGERFPPDRRDLVLVAPTWRVGLVQPLTAGAHRRQIASGFLNSAFAQSWLAFLHSPELFGLCEEQGLTIGLLPHPELQSALPLMPLPSHVRALTFADNEVQELIARCAVMVTDYSSMAFNAAYIERPVVYFQFDAEAVQQGQHLGRSGYFDYKRDGFGPVAFTVSEAIARVVETLRASRLPAPTYHARIARAFPLRDGQCCARVTAEIEASTRRAAPTQAPTDPEQSRLQSHQQAGRWAS